MTLLPLDSRSLIDLAARWLSDETHHQWLDFGGGRQMVTPALLNVMLQRSTNFVRAFTSASGRPIGLVALHDVNRLVGTASLWSVTAEDSIHSRGHATLAASRFLTVAFAQLGLGAINTWVAEPDPARRMLERLNFRYVGRMRQCHAIGGRLCDRVYYDLLASEHHELGESEFQQRTQVGVAGDPGRPDHGRAGR
jgi:RimJ/RimL family protein N-acetyltransferase